MLNIIIATKQPVLKKLYLCLSSIAALKFAGKIKVILIYSGSIHIIPNEIITSFGDFVLYKMDALGVYAAYNKGLDFINEGYVLFLGDGDMVLPGLDSVIEQITHSRLDVDLVGCLAYMQMNEDTSSLPPIRFMVLWRNWCHQSCLYNSKLFSVDRFDERYKIQADHAFNIKSISGKKTRLLRIPTLISYFSAGGLTSSKNDLIFRADLPKIARNHFGIIGYLFTMIRSQMANIIKGKPSEIR